MENLFTTKILHERNLKATPTRIEVLKIIDEAGTAIPLAMIQNRFKETDRVTLYRTMQVLTEKGIIHKVYDGAGETYYALCGKRCNDKQHDHNHIHFKCTECDMVSCEYPEENISIKIPDFIIEKVQVNIEGICPRCKNKFNNNPES